VKLQFWSNVKIWVYSFNGFWSYVGLHFGMRFPTFSAPPSGETVRGMWIRIRFLEMA